MKVGWYITNGWSKNSFLIVWKKSEVDHLYDTNLAQFIDQIRLNLYDTFIDNEKWRYMDMVKLNIEMVSVITKEARNEMESILMITIF